MSEVSPAHEAGRLSRDVLEEVLLELKNMGGRVDRSTIVGRIDQAIVGLHSLGKSALSEPLHLKLLEGATELVKQAAEAVEGRDFSDESIAMNARLLGVVRTLEQAREATIDALVEAQQEFAEEDVVVRAKERVPEPARFRLSSGVAQLHALDREVMRTHVDVRPDDFVYSAPDEDMDLDALEGFAAAEELTELDVFKEESNFDDDEEDDEALHITSDSRLPLLSEQTAAGMPMMRAGLDGELAQLQRLIRTCLEDIGAMSLLRRFDDDERFDLEGVRRFEMRICECLDAAIALGTSFQTSAGPGSCYAGVDVLAETVQYARDGLTADPARAFARALLLTSVAGQDTVRAALLAFKQSPPYTYRAQAEAFVLSPNPALDTALQRLARDDEPAIAALALDTLARRGEVDIGVVLPLVDHPVEEVRLGAIAALGRTKQHQAAAETLIQICDKEMDDDIFVEAAEGLIVLGYREGLVRLRDRLDEEEEEQGTLRDDLRVRCMHLLGMAGKADDYVRLLQLYYGDVGQAMALGFHGHPALVAELISALDSSREEGLYLGTRGMRDAARALYRITGAPLFQERPVGGDPYDIITEQNVWFDWWKANEDRFEPNVRYRYGQPFSLLHSVAELERDHVPFGVRLACAREISLHNLPQRVSATAFVDDQQRSLGALRVHIEEAHQAGEAGMAAGRWLTLSR